MLEDVGAAWIYKRIPIKFYGFLREIMGHSTENYGLDFLVEITGQNYGLLRPKTRFSPYQLRVITGNYG